MDQRVAIVGGGYAGMAAASTLAERGVPVTVFESGPVPGGRARRVVSQGHELDNGQHIFVGAYTELFRLMRVVGVPSDALLRYPLEVRYADGFQPSRAGGFPRRSASPPACCSREGVPLAERLGALRFMAALRRMRFRVEPDITVKQLLDDHRPAWRACATTCGRRFAFRRSTRRSTRPRPTRSSPRCATRSPAAATRATSSCRASTSRACFPEPAADFIRARGGEVRCGTTVRDLETLKTQFRRIIVAVGPHQLKTLLPEAIADFTYQPIYTCYLQYPETTRLDFPMLGMADGLVQWVFDRGALLGEKGRLACVISAQGDHQQMTQDELAETCHRELARAKLVAARTALDARHRREARDNHLHAGRCSDRDVKANGVDPRRRLHRSGISADAGSRGPQRRAGGALTTQE